MLTQEYNALRRFERQFSDIQSIHRLKSYLKANMLELSLKVSSPTVWILDWDVLSDAVSGTLELRIEPILTLSGQKVPLQESSFRMQDPKPNSLVSIEKKLIGFIRNAFVKIN